MSDSQNAPAPPGRPARLLLPLFGIFILVLIEASLRLAGVASFSEDPFIGFAGNHPAFVLQDTPNGPVYVTAKDKQRYISRQVFPAQKPDKTFRIFTLGGSVVLGFPFGYDGSFSRLLQQGLSAVDLTRRFEVINAGGFGYASYRVRRLLQEIMEYEPDLVVIMAGHNEFLERRVYGDWTSYSPVLVKVRELLNRLRIYRGLKSFVLAVRGQDSRPILSEDVTWDEIILDQDQRRSVLTHYGYNMREMARLCRSRDVPLIVVTLPCNLRDYPPQKSRHRLGLTNEQLMMWYDAYSDALLAYRDWNYDLALLELNKAGAIDPEYAEYHYYRGRILLEMQQPEQALKWLWKAVAHDAQPVRAYRSMNNLVRSLPGNGVYLADAEEAFYSLPASGVPGDDLFLDHCHPALEGQKALAFSIAETMIEERLIPFTPYWNYRFQSRVNDYIGSLPQKFLAEAYYRVAYESGVNMQRRKRGLRLAYLAYELNPAHPRVKPLIERLEK